MSSGDVTILTTGGSVLLARNFGYIRSCPGAQAALPNVPFRGPPVRMLPNDGAGPGTSLSYQPYVTVFQRLIIVHMQPARSHPHYALRILGIVTYRLPPITRLHPSIHPRLPDH